MPDDFEAIYHSVVGANSETTSTDPAPATPPPVAPEQTAQPTAQPTEPVQLSATAADQAGGPPEQLQTPTPLQPQPVEFAIDDELWNQLLAEENSPDEQPLPTLERFASVTDPAERAELERLLQATQTAREQYAPLAEPLELVGGVEPAGKLLNILGIGMLGDTPAYDVNGQPLGITNLQWSVRALDKTHRQFFDQFVGQALTYAPELAYQNLPKLLQAVDNDPHLPAEIKQQVAQHLDEYAKRKGYELAVDAESQRELLGQLNPKQQELFWAFSREDQKAITEAFRDYGMPRALRELSNSAYRFENEQREQQGRQEQVYAQHYEQSFKGNHSYNQQLVGMYDTFIQRLVKGGVDEMRAEGLVARAYKQMLNGYWNRDSQEHQTMTALQQSLLPRDLRMPQYRDIGATPLERQNLQLAVTRLFKAHLDKAGEKYRRAANHAPQPPAQPPQRQAPPNAQPQFQPERPPAPNSSPTPITSDYLENLVQRAMAQYGQ